MKSTLTLSPLQKERLQFQPELPHCLEHVASYDFQEGAPVSCEDKIRPLFPNLCNNPELTLHTKPASSSPQKVGVVLSGGQAPGGHTVIAAIFDTLQALNPQSRLIGFLNGPSGIVKNQFCEITKEMIALYRNQGGFDIIGSGRTKIETKEQFAAALQTARTHSLDGLIVIGGDDSNTNAAFLAEYFLQEKCPTTVIGVPKTIDGDLQNEAIELSFGFDTACKTYSEAIGNIARDALSAKKYYYFIKLMGRSASHITLECALSTQPNLALIGEEIAANNWTLEEVSQQVVELIRERFRAKKQFGVILIPEGIIEFMPDVKALIRHLNQFLASQELDKISSSEEKIAFVQRFLPEELKRTFSLLSQEIQLQLLLDRDPHGNVQVSKIETERLFIHLASKQLDIPFSAQPIFCGYEGRSALPTNFDCTYCYALGTLSALLVARKRTGYIASFQGLAEPVHAWQAKATPLISMLHMEEREGKQKAVIQKALVNLSGAPFQTFAQERAKWRLEECYRQPGPIQFFGPQEIVNSIPISLRRKK